MNNALLYLGGLLVVTLAALFAVPHFIDWNGYRGVFEEEATKVLGRDVRVGGAVNVRFLPTPFVRFEKVRLADPTGQTGEPFVRIDSFTMRLSGPALLRGVLEANEIELHRPVLTLALDTQGGGNWTSVQIRPGALPFVPQDVALHSVKIIDGTVALFNSEAQSIARAEAVNGEFSAEALKGPFKFKGQAKWSGEAREIKFATTVPDAAGVFQIKANTRAIASETSYMLDGRIEGLSTKPRLTGELTGKIPLTITREKKPADTAAVETPVMDMRARIDATTAGAKVEDIALALENAAEPQLIAGTAAAVWGTAPRLDVALTSKWLDLDRLSGSGQDSATFVKVKQFGLAMLRALAGDGAASAKIDVDQVKLGGETAGVLKIDAERQGSAVQLRQLKAGLPGGSRLDLSGDLKDDNGKVSFAGSGFVPGSNLARLLGWAAKSGANLDIKADGPFAA
ncbi:MAG: AsmA family protein, partial [Hyphomicrobium sp.]